MADGWYDIVNTAGTGWHMVDYDFPQPLSSRMTAPLKSILLQIIRESGPLSIAQYMHLCHAHDEHGYYANSNPIGREGDFITSPLISQMFGEMIALWCISAWKAIGKPDEFQLTELGAGHATMMIDLLRVAKIDKEFTNATKLSLIETSKTLREIQQKNLRAVKETAHHFETIEQLAPKPTLFIANEFFDAIPFRQFVKVANHWSEICIGVDQNQNLIFTKGDTQIDHSLLPSDHQDQPDGAVFEYAPAREAIISTVATQIAAHGGAALFIDYGHAISGYSNTFQAVHKHQKIAPLIDPGNCDLTSHVDFGRLKIAAENEGLQVFPLMAQGEFLLKSGLLERAGGLGQGKSEKFQHQIHADVERLAGAEQMGGLFKVFCMTTPDTKIPPFAD